MGSFFIQPTSSQNAFSLLARPAGNSFRPFGLRPNERSPVALDPNLILQGLASPGGVGFGALDRTLGGLKTGLRAGAAELGRALGAIGRAARRTEPTFTTGVVPGTFERTAGFLANIGGGVGAHSILQATNEVNQQVTTIRQSLAALGLDVSSPEAHSIQQALREINEQTTTIRRSAFALGLDTTTAEAHSIAQATREINERVAAIRQSLSALGLDVSSPEAHSILQATREINENTSTIRQSTAALALDVTTAESHSVFQANNEVNTTPTSIRMSTAGLGLDVTTAEGHSFLQGQNEVNASTTTVRTSTAAMSAMNTVGARSTLVSTAEANTATTSYGSWYHNFPGGTGDAELSGVYAGTGAAAGSTSLTIRMTAASTLSATASAFSFRVENQAGTVLYSFTGNAVADQQFFLGADIGLTVKFKAGSYGNNRTSSTTVSTATPTDVSTTATFNSGNENNRPRFENNQQVVAGSFTINGVAISVLAGDSISSVMTRINASAAGVTATWAGDKLTLTSNADSESAITVGGDTSNFLTAVKLTGATTTTGNIADDVQAFSQVPQFASVTNGSFDINGVNISVSTSDTLQAVIARINASAANVTASYDAATKKVTFTPNVGGATLTINNDTSGFLGAANIVQGTAAAQLNVNGAFNDDSVSGPLFDLGTTVTAGSFTINGVTINVAANDTVNTVIGKINASGAGVTASYDGATEKFRIESTYNTDQAITLGSDTSGFLAAVKITAGTGATSTAGFAQGHRERFNESTRFGSVTAGSFSVNGTSITVSTTDTLEDVIARVNASGAGVTASFDTGTNKLVFTPDTAGATLTIENDTSGLLAAANITQGTVGTKLNVNAAINGSGANAPLFDGGYTVTAGSFKVNGVTINVLATDSVNDVLGKINASSAGVSATYDAATDKIRLESTYNTRQAISLSDDTTGLVAALKLDGSATNTAGFAQGHRERFAESVRFGSVTSGSFNLNGVSITVNTTDTLEDVIARVNASAANVTASFDTGTNKLVFTPNTAGATLTIDGDTSGLLAAANITEGTIGTVVNVNGAFNATGASGPLFDPGTSVTAGSFSINGVTINVAASDSINGVIAKINASSAGVTASFDAATETFKLETTYNSGQAISFGADSSGFLAAVKITAGTGASSTVGFAQGHRERFSESARFGAVTNGAFELNGTTINVYTTDTVESLIARINAAGTDVTASFDTAANKVVFTPGASGLMSLENDTSGFLAAADVATGTDGITVNLNGAFNGTGMSNPLFDSGVTVTAGSFKVNGVTINVAANDTVNTVLAKINASSAGVNATFDAATETIKLETTYNSRLPISLADDTSGFLAAVKLTAGTGISDTAGFAQGDKERFSESVRFGSVTAGSFSINGTSISVGTTDTLQAVIARINAAGAGVTASFDTAANELVFTPNTAGATLTIDGDTSGLLAAAGISQGTIGTQVNVNGAFNDTGATGALLDPGTTVTAGSFDINGVTINVAANDTVNSVIGKINASAAGVSASFDAATETIKLETTYNSRLAISLANDTSGFLAAVKVTAGTGATSTAGFAQGHRERFSESTRFGSVTNGSFSLNGTSINIYTTDTVETLVTRINAAGAGVTASFDTAANKLVFTPNTAGATLSIENDTSGFFTAGASNVALGTQGTVVNPNAAFNATGLSSPLFDPGVTVTAGSFRVNGVTISVNANDTLNDVLARITSSAANVTATFDAATEKVKLETTTDTSTPITVDNDTSGFLAAVKLTAATGVQSTPGVDPFVQTPDTLIQDSPDLAAVTAGTITVNGTNIAVDPTTQTTRDLVTLIDTVSGVQATIDAFGQIKIRGEQKEDAVTISDTSGLLSALGVATGFFEGRPDRIVTVASPDGGRQKLIDPDESSRQLAAAVDGLNQALKAAFQGTDETRALEVNIREGLDITLREAFAQGAIVLDPGAKPAIRVDPEQLKALLQRPADEFNQTLRKLDDLATSVKTAVERTEQETNRETLTGVVRSLEDPTVFKLAQGTADSVQVASQRQQLDTLVEAAAAVSPQLPRVSAFAATQASRAYSAGAGTGLSAAAAASRLQNPLASGGLTPSAAPSPGGLSLQNPLASGGLKPSAGSSGGFAAQLKAFVQSDAKPGLFASRSVFA